MPKNEDDLASVQPVLEMAQRLHGSLQQKLVERGIQPIDVLIAGTYATHAFATKVHGSPIAAVEWMRDAIDTIERQLLDAAE